MTACECPREDEVLSTVHTGRWPSRADADLRAHVDACEVCRDLAAVASAFAEASEAVAGPVPDASVVWIRAQLRARADAVRLAERPVTVGQAIFFAAIVGMLGAVFGAASPWLRTCLGWMEGVVAHLDPRGLSLPQSVWALAGEHLGLVALVGTALAVMPAVVYWVVREE